jgi:excisionase family DNA binding protein
MTAPTVPPLLTCDAAAAILGLPASMVGQLVREKRLPSVAIGRRRYVPRDALPAWIAAEPAAALRLLTQNLNTVAKLRGEG